MAALPYMQLYVADYLADTMHLNTEEHGAYMLLMFNYWQTGKPIPKTRLAAIARLSNDRWTTVEVSLNEFFNDTGTHWEHKRIEADLLMCKEAQEQRSKAGKASAEARKNKKRESAKSANKLQGTTVPTTVENPLNGNSTNKDKDKDKDIKENKQKKRGKPLDLSFDDFWKAYPKKQAKKTCRDSWKRKKLDSKIEKILSDITLKKRSHPNWLGGYIPNPSTYLNQEHWDDDWTPEAEVNQFDPERKKKQDQYNHIKKQIEDFEAGKINDPSFAIISRKVELQNLAHELGV